MPIGNSFEASKKWKKKKNLQELSIKKWNRNAYHVVHINKLTAPTLEM